MKFGKSLWIVAVALAAAARLLPHPWNFTPMLAIGLFAGYQARRSFTGASATIAALLVSDAFLGFYPGFQYVYLAALIPVALARLARRFPGLAPLAGATVASSLLFFLTTNFMVWARGTMYPHTSAGLSACMIAGIPFYQNQILGDLFYTAAIFALFALLTRATHPVPQPA